MASIREARDKNLSCYEMSMKASSAFLVLMGIVMLICTFVFISGAADIVHTFVKLSGATIGFMVFFSLFMIFLGFLGYIAARKRETTTALSGTLGCLLLFLGVIPLLAVSSALIAVSSGSQAQLTEACYSEVKEDDMLKKVALPMGATDVTPQNEGDLSQSAIYMGGLARHFDNIAEKIIDANMCTAHCPCFSGRNLNSQAYTRYMSISEVYLNQRNRTHDYGTRAMQNYVPLFWSDNEGDTFPNFEACLVKKFDRNLPMSTLQKNKELF